MARDIPAGTRPGAQRPTNRTTVSATDYKTVNFWERTLGDWAWWDVYEYDEEQFTYGPCGQKLPYEVKEVKTWSLSATGGVSQSGSGSLSGKGGNIGVEWSTTQGFGYATTGGVTVTLKGEVPARSGFRPVLIIQYRVREYDVRYYDMHWTSATRYNVKIKFRTVVGIEHGYIPCERTER